MPLSAHEQKMLDQIEVGLRAAAPKVSARRSTAARAPGLLHRQMLMVIVGIAVGFALVLAGLISKAIVVSVIGFVLIVVAATATRSNPAQLWSRARRAASRLVNPPSGASQRARNPARDTDQL